MQCSCDIKALFSVGCKCGGFAAEQAARTNGSSAIASAPASKPGVYAPAPIPHLSGSQDQILVVGKNTGSEYWVKASDWKDHRGKILTGRVHKGVGSLKVKEGLVIRPLFKQYLYEAAPQLQRAVSPTNTKDLIP